jgi:hypothetical protein
LSRGSSSTTSLTPRIRVSRHVTRLLIDYLLLHYAFECLGTSRSSSCGSLRGSSHRLVVDYFAYAAFSGASAHHGSSRRSSSTTSLTPRVWVPRHFTRLVTRLVVDYSVRRDFVGHTGSTSAMSCVATTCLVATLALLRVRRAPPRRRLSVASCRPFISISFPN